MAVIAYLNKTSLELKVFGSLSAASKELDMSINTLYFHFSQMKKTVYETNYFKLEKMELIRAPRIKHKINGD